MNVLFSVVLLKINLLTYLRLDLGHLTTLSKGAVLCTNIFVLIVCVNSFPIFDIICCSAYHYI